MIKENYDLDNYLDLRGIPCPINYIRSSLAIEELHENECLTIDLDKGEPYQMVTNGLSQAGHDIKILLEVDNWVRLLIICCVK